VTPKTNVSVVASHDKKGTPREAINWQGHKWVT